MNFFSQLFRTDHRETNGDFLFFRIFELVILYQVVFYAWEWGFYIPQLGKVILPLGMANYIDVSFMFSGPYSLVNAALITFFVLLGYFYQRGRIFYLLAVIGMHLQYISRYSQGEISHGSNFTVTALVCFALAALFFAEGVKQRKFAMGLFIFLIGMGYTSAACSKLVATGITWVDGRHLYLWVSERSTDKLSQDGAFQLNFLQILLLKYRWLATGILSFGLLTEFFGFLLWFKKTRWIQATVLIGMHFGIFLTMNINFRSYLIILMIVGYPWGRWFDYMLQRKSDSAFQAFLTQRRLASP